MELEHPHVGLNGNRGRWSAHDRLIAGKGKLRFKIQGVVMTKGLEEHRNDLTHSKGPVLIITKEPNDPRSMLEKLEIHLCK